MPEEAVMEQAPARKLTLREVTDVLTQWRDTLDGTDGSDADFAYVRAMYEQSVAQHSDKVDAFCAFMRRAKEEKEHLAADELRFYAKKNALEKLLERYRNYALETLKAHGDSLRGRVSTIALCDGEQHQRPHIDDMSKLPPEYVTEVPAVVTEAHREPRLKEIERALKAGKEVPGARLTAAKPYIQIR